MLDLISNLIQWRQKPVSLTASRKVIMLDTWSSYFPPWRSGGLLLLVLCWAGKWEDSLLVHTTVFVLSGLQASRVCQASSVLCDRWNRSQSLEQPPEKLNHWMCGPALFFPRKKLGSACSSLSWGVGRECYSECACMVDQNVCSSSHQASRGCWTPLALLGQARQKPVSRVQPPPKLQC